MAERRSPAELLTFPCHYEFKVFGAADDVQFVDAVLGAVGRVIAVGRDAARTRLSSGGRYQCVTVLARLENSAQLSAVYAMLRDVKGLAYLL